MLPGLDPCENIWGVLRVQLGFLIGLGFLIATVRAAEAPAAKQLLSACFYGKGGKEEEEGDRAHYLL